MIIMKEAIFLKYQKEWRKDKNSLKVCEKSRRIGISWTEAGDSVLYTAKANGGDTLYIGYNKDMTLEFMNDCRFFSRIFNIAAQDLEEGLFEDEKKDILKYTIRFNSGHKISALSSAPTNLRSKGRPQQRVIIDEAAYVEDLDRLLKAAYALTMWGGEIHIISTHNGEDNAFNALIEDINSKKIDGNVHTYDLNRALKDGLFHKICTVNKKEYSTDSEDHWKETLLKRYRDNADEELFCIPSKGGGVWLSRFLIQSCMSPDIPVIRLEKQDNFSEVPIEKRTVEIQQWCDDNLKFLIQSIEKPLYIGEDFARNRNYTSIVLLEQMPNTQLRAPFILELWNIPFRQQEQILFYLIDNTEMFAGACLDARGNGAQLAEAMRDTYGKDYIDTVQLSDKWYSEWMPIYKAAFEDSTIILPQDSDILEDHRSIRKVKGIPKVVKRQKANQTKSAENRIKQRHGDSAIAGSLCVCAAHTFTYTETTLLHGSPHESNKILRGYDG